MKTSELPIHDAKMSEFKLMQTNEGEVMVIIAVSLHDDAIGLAEGCKSWKIRFNNCWNVSSYFPGWVTPLGKLTPGSNEMTGKV